MKPQEKFAFEGKKHVAVLDAGGSIWYGEINQETQEWKDASKFRDCRLSDRQRKLLDAACKALGVNSTNQEED